MTSLKIGIGYEWWKKNRLSVKPIFALSVNHYRNEEVLVVLWLIPRVVSILTRSCIWISVNDVCAVVSTISIPGQCRSLFSSRSFLPYWLGFQRPNTKQTEIPLCVPQCSSAPHNLRNLQLHSPHSLGSYFCYRFSNVLVGVLFGVLWFPSIQRVFTRLTIARTPSLHQVYQNRSYWLGSVSPHWCYR